MKNIRIMSKCLVLALVAAMALHLASCGGGGGGGTPIVSFPSTTATVTGTISSITADSVNLGRAAGKAARTASAATTVTDFSDFTVTAGGKTGTITGNKYTIADVPPGKNILVEIKNGKIHLKTYLPNVEAGKSHTKAVSVTTTAAAVVWEEL
ncbi:MAG: hypothetical protein ABIH66_01090, partial [bacterium]